MTSSEIREFIQNWVRAFERQDVDALVSCYADDCTIDSPIFHTIRGRDNVRATFLELFGAFVEWSVQVHEIVIDREQDERAVVAFTIHSTKHAALSAIPSLDGRIELSGVIVFRFDDGRILSETRVYSFASLLESLEKARTDRELKIAAEVQRALLPRTSHAGAYFEAVGASLACRAIGGDFFEYVDVAAGDFGVALGDVSGKGPAAALLASMLQGIFSVEAAAGGSPSAILGRMNHALLRRVIEPRFATLVYGVLSPDGQFVYSSAGHNPPLLLRKGTVRHLRIGGSILGVFGDAVFGEETLYLEAGDTVILYTDGVTEAFNADDEEFGEDRLMSFATVGGRTPSELLDGILTAVREFCSGTVQSDDVTMIVLRFR